MDNATARWAWSLLHAVVGAAILWYRFVTPVRQFRRHQLRVDSTVRESADTVSVVIRGRNLHEMGAEAGQFFRCRFLTKDKDKDLGDHSRALAGLPLGTRVFTKGPYGVMTAARRTRRKVLLLAGGVGITPIRALFRTLPGRARRPDLHLPGQ